MKVLLISSPGGHWVQMCRLKPAFTKHQLIFATTDSDYASLVPGFEFYTVPDANQWSKLKLLKQAIYILWLIIRTNPDAVISTGASAGYFALFFAKKLNKKTIWIDSIANCDELSLSGKKVAPFADLYLTQWEHIKGSAGNVRYAGSVLE